MSSSLTNHTKNALQKQKRKKRWQKVLSVLAAVVVFVTTYMLILPAITLEYNVVCGKEEHTHTEDCYATKPETREITCTLESLELHKHTGACYDAEGNLICGIADYVVHTHDDNCYDENGKLICTLKEVKLHTHDNSCYSNGALVCGKQEVILHNHTEACYDSNGNLICGMLETKEHQHTEECFAVIPATQTLVCEKEEHEHSEKCYEIDENQNNDENDNKSVAEKELSSTDGEKTQDESNVASVKALSDDAITDEGNVGAGAVLYNSGESEIQSSVQTLDDSGTMQTGIDFSQYITNATVSKIENGKWVVSDTFRDGDQVKVGLEYKIPEGVVTTDNRTIYYQLPSGIRPIENLSGKVYQNNIEVGDYTITTDGLIQIVFYQEFANGDEFEGNIEFHGTVSADDAGEGGKVEFGGSGNSITIEAVPEEEKTDIKITKTGVKNDSASNQVDYTVTITTENGTRKEVTFQDYLGSNGAYTGSVGVTRVDVNGTRTVIENVTVTRDTVNGAPQFSLSSLPALEAGESYVITYSATATPNADGFCKLSNSASANGVSTWNDVTISNSKISKSGWYDDKTDKMNWTINISDCAGYTLSDIITASDGTVINLPETVTLKATDGTTEEIHLPYIFGADKTGSYTITYQTEAPKTDGATANNTVSLTDRSGSGGSYSSSANPSVTHRSWAVSKNWVSEKVTDGQRQYLWNAQVIIPAGVLSKFSYTDTITDITDADGNSLNAHYAIASQLQAAIEANLKLELTNGTELNYKNNEVDFLIVYKDANDNEVLANNTTIPVQSFTITVEPKAETTIENAYRLVLNGYPTNVDTSKMNEGETWNFQNKGESGNLTSEAGHQYTKPYPLVKMVGIPDQYGGMNFTDGSAKVDYNEDGTLTYRLVINTELGSSGDIVLTDTLPEGMCYVDNSLEAVFDHGSWTTVWGPGENYNIGVDKKPNVSVGDNTLTITILDGYNTTTSASTIWITYKVSIKDDSFWSDLTHEEKKYTNSVTWDKNSGSQETTVEREIQKVQKDAKQLTDDNGKPIDTVEYTVTINPAGDDLDPGSDTLTLTDTLNLPEGAGAYLDLTNTKLYQYDSTANNNLGALVDTVRYQMSYDELTHKFTVILPDALACILVYRYNIDRGNLANDLNLVNSVSLAGEWADDNEWKLIEVGAQASVTKGKLTIYKVDASDYTKCLSGAKFQLDAWDADSQSWKKIKVSGADNDGYYTTDGNGELVFSGGDDDRVLNLATLYRLKEVTPPEGYEKSDIPSYFVLMKAPESGGTATKESTLEYMKNVFNESWNESLNSGVSKDDVNFYPNNREVTMYIPNTYTELNVKKVWVDENGGTLNDPPGNVQVQLIQSSRTFKGCTVTISSTGGGQDVDAEEFKVPVNGTLTITNNDWGMELTVKCGENVLAQIPARNSETITVTSDMELTVESGFAYSGLITVVASDPTESDYDITSTRLNTVTLTAKNDWSYIWKNEDIPATDTSGNPYYYTIEEINVPDGYTVTYNNNDGIQTGEIVVTNQKNPTEEDYTLPETGGSGTIKYIMGGILLMLASVLLYIKQHIKEGRRKHIRR